MKTENKNSEKFPGFQPIGKRNTYWQYPNIMDFYWYKLSSPEQKVLDYLLRRTFGFHKIIDSISHGQFMRGIKRGEKIIDKGIGLNDKTIGKALDRLEQMGFIKIKRSIDKKTGKNNTNEYRLVMAPKNKGGVGDTSGAGVRDALPHGVRDTGTIKSLKINRKIKREIEEIHACYRERINAGARLTKGVEKQIAERLKLFTPEDLKQAIHNFADDEWWMDNHSSRGMFWFFRYDDRVEQFVNMEPVGYFNPDDRPEKYD